MPVNLKKIAKLLIAIVSLLCVGLIITLGIFTLSSIRPFSEDLTAIVKATEKQQYKDRYGRKLNVTYKNEWNVYDNVFITAVPNFLRQAFIISEDKRFFHHAGVDWLARFNALAQNIVSGKNVRGASTITEQVVRMLHPRPRTIWSRWVEGFEASILEQKYTKIEILEFYLNQVPYRSQRRGVKQAAQFYFNRTLDTLNKKEMLSLTVFIRSPKWFDPEKHRTNLEKAVVNLAQRMINKSSLIVEADIERIQRQELLLSKPALEIEAQHFIKYVGQYDSLKTGSRKYINTTLDADLQNAVQKALDSRLNSISQSNVYNGAALVVNHNSNDVLAWVVGYAGKKNKPFNDINTVVVKRQPGSTLKPFLYARAIEKGWTAATMLEDSPLEESVGVGMHSYHNYGRDHYGFISVREALGNSLNIPAIRGIQYIGAAEFLTYLHKLGINSLNGHPTVYGDGLALGNGEISLLELVQAYTVLARMGDYKALSVIENQFNLNSGQRVISEDISSLLTDILSDPSAREKEFGMDSILNLPHQTAVKTGTSSDYRDAWAVGFNDRYTVGVWMGNLDYSEMNGITGSSGPAVVLRTIFNELNKTREVKSLYISKNLKRFRVCVETGALANNNCASKDEWFIPGGYPTNSTEMKDITKTIRIRKPTNGLRLAMDPRIPDELEYFEFELNKVNNLKKVDWYVNNTLVGSSTESKLHWKLKQGDHVTKARIWIHGDNNPVVTDEVKYTVN